MRISAADKPETVVAHSLASRPVIADAHMLLSGICVLVVDDDDAGRQIVAEQLQARHADVLTASSAAQAFAMLQAEHVDVLLADIAMPGEDGYSLIRKVRALQSHSVSSIPAAALTAFARNEDRIQALQAGFQSHLAKPIDADLLVTTVARLGGKLPERRATSH